jgi:hypothetical protein
MELRNQMDRHCPADSYAMEYEFLPGELGAWTRIPLPASLGPNPPPFFSPREHLFLPGELGAPLGPLYSPSNGPDAPHFFSGLRE